jgi:hypothetical protein
MTTALKAEEMYSRVYVDCKLKLYCFTAVPLKKQTHYPIVADEFALRNLCQTLKADGFTAATRPAFEVLVRE